MRSGTTLSNTRFLFYPENGSNANGKFRKLSDGTMICTLRYTNPSAAISTAFLGGFRTGAIVWTYPAAFVEEPEVIITPSNGSASGGVESSGDASSITFFLTAVASQAAASREASLTAVGRWGVV